VAEDGPGGDFGAFLREERARAGLLQAELAKRAGLTSAYVSLLESGKKPPPSDRVALRLAEALGAAPARVLEVAHLAKTPSDVRRKYRLLDSRLHREQRKAQTLVEDMLPLTLFNFLRDPGILDLAERLHEGGLARVSREGIDAISGIRAGVRGVESFREFRRESREAIEALGEDERRNLVETLQALSDWEAGRPAGGPSPAGEEKKIPVFDAVPPGPAADRAGLARGFLPVVASRWKPSRWALAVSDDTMFPRLERGDLVVFEEAALPRTGDLVAVSIDGGGSLVGRYTRVPGEIEIAPVNPAFPPRRFPRRRDAPKGYALRGVGVEVIRTLRP
jgi:transcriptional regulator with XRE-family HTH domain